MSGRARAVLAVVVAVVLLGSAVAGVVWLDATKRRQAAELEQRRREDRRTQLEAAFASADKHVAAAKKVFNDVEYAFNTAFYVRVETATEQAAPHLRELDRARGEIDAADKALGAGHSPAVVEYRKGLADLRAAVEPTKKSIALVASLSERISSGDMTSAEWRAATAASPDRRSSLRLKQRAFEAFDKARLALAAELRELEKP